MFDAKTVMLLWAAETLTLAFLLFGVWLRQRAKTQYLLFAGGFALNTIGCFLVMLRGQIPNFASIQVGNTVALLGFACWLSGLLKSSGKKIEGWVAIPALLWIAFMFVPPVRDSMAYRIVLYHTAAGLGYLMLASVLLSYKGKLSATRKILAGMLAFQALCGGLTGYVVIQHNMATGNVVPLTTITAVYGALFFVTVITLSAMLYIEETEKRLHLLATTDELTGVRNRRGLTEEFDRLAKRSVVSGNSVALILFDIDHFKKINDRYGHQSGDIALTRFSRMAETIIAETGMFVRMGGEEFALLLETALPERAIMVAETIRLHLARTPLDDGKQTIPVTVSVGIATDNTGTPDLNTLMTISDRALYAAKKAGRNRTVFFNGENNVVIAANDRDEDPMDNNANRQVAALTRITAIANR